MKLDIRVLVGKIYYSFISYPGIGGLPVGSSGHGLTMISGGFDSPVASFLMAKRGLRQTFIFFHAAPYIGNEVVEKIKSIVSLLAKYQRQSHLYVVPFGNIQKVISQFCHEQHMMEYQTLFFRREMVRLSEMLLPKIKAECIVVGDSLGQVSSQTLSNMHIMNQSVACPILRPLIGLNKMEILKIAEAIKTHDLSMIPFDDACSLFAPKNPVIQPDESVIKDFDQNVLRAELFQKERLLALETMEAYAISVRGELQLTDAVR